MRVYHNFNDCVDSVKQQLGPLEYWIFEDSHGEFHAVSLTDGQATFEHYTQNHRWIPRGRVLADIKVIAMWTGAIPSEEALNKLNKSK